MNYRNTIQRDLVMAAVERLMHPTAEEVYRKVKESHPSISRATVYRNLNLLVDQTKLRRITTRDADHFDITLAGHYHITCKTCGKVVDAPLPYQAELVSSLADTHGFLVEDHDIILRGHCPDCLAQTAGNA